MVCTHNATMIIECVHCYFKIDDSCKFCHQCGNPPQSNICSKCRPQCSQDLKFCSQCGTPVSITTGPSRQAMRSCFDITIEENDAAKRCHLKGKYVINVSATGIDLLDSRQNVVYSWPRAYVRRYGVDNKKTVFIIDVGRMSDSGEGQFRFQTRKAQEINDLIHCHFTQSHNPIPTVDPILQQEVDNRQGSFISDESERRIQLPSREQSAVSTSTTDGVDNSLGAMRNLFDITIEENESAKRCHLKGNYIIHVSATDIGLLDSRHKLVYSWPGTYIRRYGVEFNQNVLVIEVGRKSDSGEGQFKFRTRKAQEIHDLIQCRFSKLLESHHPIPTVAPILAQDVANRQGSSTSKESERSIPLPKRLQSKVPSPTTNDTDNSLAALSHCFDITIDENDAAKRCHLKGNYIIYVSATGIGLLDSRHNLVYSWPHAYIRRYGVDSNKNMLLIDVGRKSDSGEGQFRFRTHKAQEINDLIQGHFTKLLESHHPIPTVAPILAQDVANRQGSSTSEESERSIPLPKRLQSKVPSPTTNDTDNSLAALSHCFDITIDENDAAKRCHLKGNYIIHVSATGIGLLDSRHNLVYSWPRACIRRYGVESNKNMLLIDVGRKSDSGEGQFRFRTRKAQEINDLIQGHFTKLLESHNHMPTVAPFLTQEVANQQRQNISEESERSLQPPKNRQFTVSSSSKDGTDNSLVGTKSNVRNIPPSYPTTACNPIYSEPIKPDESGDPLVLPEANKFHQAALKTDVEQIHKEDYIHVKSTWEVQKQDDNKPPLPPRPSNSNDDDGTYVGLCCYYNELKFEKKALENWRLNPASQGHGSATGLTDPLPEQRYYNLSCRQGSEKERDEDQDDDKDINQDDRYEPVNH